MSSSFSSSSSRLLSSLAVRRFSTKPLGPNHDLIQALAHHKTAELVSTAPNPHKVRAFERAIKVIAALKQPVQSGGQVRQLIGIGPGVAARIDAFLANVPYVRDPPAQVDRTRLILASLKTVYGIGTQKAQMLYDAGCTSIPELTRPEFFKLLSPSQKVGARFAKHLDQAVSPSQAQTVKEFVSQNISSKFEVLLTGDHRRDVSSSHVNLIVLHPFEPQMSAPEGSLDRETKPRPPKPTRLYTMGQLFVNLTQSAQHTSLYADVVSPLESRGLVTATIAGGPQRWRGVVRIPLLMANGDLEDRDERIRQIEKTEGRYTMLDIFFVPRRCKGAALVTLTGDSDFVTDILGRAHRLGLCLNEYGLWKWHDEGFWEFMHGDEEEAIFRDVDMDFVVPERRNFGYLRRKRGRPRKASVEQQAMVSTLA